MRPVCLAHATTPTTRTRRRQQRRRHTIPPHMSGKAPPRGPRALLSSLPTPASASQTSTSLPSTSTSPSSSKIGALPPTAPRSLANGVASQPRTKPLLNGYPPTSPTVTHAPLAPRSSQKGKQVELGWSASDVSLSFCNQSESTLSARATCSPKSLCCHRRPRNPPQRRSRTACGPTSLSRLRLR